MRHVLGAVCLTTLLACGSGRTLPPASATPEPAVDVPQETSRVLKADTPLTDADGNQLIGPADWTVTERDGLLELTAPEGDVKVTLVSIGADSAEAARDAAWKRRHADTIARPVLHTSEQPDGDGWSRRKVFTYQTSPSDKRIVQTLAMFANGRWLVALIDAGEATAEKRGGQLMMIFDRLYPKGHSAETFAGKRANKLDAARLSALEEFVRGALDATGIPGASYGLIQDGAVVYSGGVGVRELGKPAKVDGTTRFMIASNTKALTTLLLAKLVDQKKVRWDDKVVDVMPGFKLGDDSITQQVLVKHLVCACTGLPRQDLEWVLEWKKNTPQSSVNALASMQPTSKFGELFQYSNLMAAAGGYVAGHLSDPKRELGAAYDKAMQAQVFTPLGMTSTTFDYKKAQTGNFARPHAINLDGKTELIPMVLNDSVVPVRPAGAAWSNVDDLLKYVQMELSEGATPANYIGKDALLARRTPNVALGSDTTYGMGLMTTKASGVTVVHHGGDLFGYHSDMMWLPEHGVGAVILTNGDPGWVVRDQFRRRLLEVLFDGRAEASEAVQAYAKNSEAARAVLRSQLTVPADASAAATLATHYNNAALGDLTVRRTGGKTVFDFGEFKSEVASKKNPDGTVSYVTTSADFLGFELVAGEADGKSTLTAKDNQHEYRFVAR